LKVESLVRTLDVTPTILDMLKLPPLEDVQGTSLLPLLKGESLDLELVGYGESLEPLIVFGVSVLRFVRKGQWKYMVGMATIIPAKPIIEPIERSNSPAIMSRHAPTERMPR